MADGDYKRLGCAADGCDKHAENRLGLCATHKARLQTYGYTGDHKVICKHCGVEFFAKDKRSSRCKDCAKKGISQSIGSKKCSIDGCKNLCSKSFGLCVAHYSRQYYYKKHKAKNEKKKAIKQLANLIQSISKNKSKIDASLKPCKNCNQPVGYSSGKDKIFCSIKCQITYKKNKPEYKEYDRSRSSLRRARRRGSKNEHFNHRQIFERDKWKCRMCGVKTPASLRGTYEPNAPELDHIMPLSKGGTHSIDNAQLLCRQCNQWKSDKVLPHQQGLFTALL